MVVGINPFTHKLMLHDGVEHILLMAPTRSGKGVCTIVPTGLIWKHSIFFFDPKGELWGLTSGYRKYVLKQKVLKEIFWGSLPGLYWANTKPPQVGFRFLTEFLTGGKIIEKEEKRDLLEDAKKSLIPTTVDVAAYIHNGGNQ